MSSTSPRDSNAPVRWPMALAGFLLGFLGLFWWQNHQDGLLLEEMEDQAPDQDH